MWPTSGPLVRTRSGPVWEALADEPGPMLDFWDPGERQAGQASHNPPAISTGSKATDRCFIFIFYFGSRSTFRFAKAFCADFTLLALDLE